MGEFVNIRGEDLDRSIYRFSTFARLVEHFRTGQMAFVRPEKWDDPFENYIVGVRFETGGGHLDLGLRHTFHGSCWTRKSVSDALWRIYSPDKMSVRIRSTPRILGKCLDTALAKYQRSKWFVGRVTYLPQRKIIEKAATLAQHILKDRSEVAAANSLLFKRNSFAHEDEVRVLVIDRHQKARQGVLKVNLDPHQVVHSVLVDSRASDDLVHVYASYLKEKLGFKGRVSRSTLYSPPERLIVKLPS
jgi:hypothetical protein